MKKEHYLAVTKLQEKYHSEKMQSERLLILNDLYTDLEATYYHVDKRCVDLKHHISVQRTIIEGDSCFVTIQRNTVDLFFESKEPLTTYDAIKSLDKYKNYQSMRVLTHQDPNRICHKENIQRQFLFVLDLSMRDHKDMALMLDEDDKRILGVAINNLVSIKMGI